MIALLFLNGMHHGWRSDGNVTYLVWQSGDLTEFVNTTVIKRLLLKDAYSIDFKQMVRKHFHLFIGVLHITNKRFIFYFSTSISRFVIELETRVQRKKQVRATAAEPTVSCDVTTWRGFGSRDDETGHSRAGSQICRIIALRCCRCLTFF